MNDSITYSIYLSNITLEPDISLEYTNPQLRICPAFWDGVPKNVKARNGPWQVFDTPPQRGSGGEPANDQGYCLQPGGMGAYHDLPWAAHCSCLSVLDNQLCQSFGLYPQPPWCKWFKTGHSLRSIQTIPMRGNKETPTICQNQFANMFGKTMKNLLASKRTKPNIETSHGFCPRVRFLSHRVVRIIHQWQQQAAAAQEKALDRVRVKCQDLAGDPCEGKLAFRFVQSNICQIKKNIYKQLSTILSWK